MSYTLLFVEFSWLLVFFAFIIIAVLIIMYITLREFRAFHKTGQLNSILNNQIYFRFNPFLFKNINNVFEYYFNNSDIGFLVYDHNLNLSNANHTFTSISGYTKEQLATDIGSLLINIIDTSNINNELSEKIVNKEAFQTSTNLVNVKGDLIHLYLIAIPTYRKNIFSSYGIIVIKFSCKNSSDSEVYNESQNIDNYTESIIKERNEFSERIVELEKAFKKSSKHHIQLQKALLENEIQRKKLQEAIDLINKQKDELEKANAEIKEHSRMKELFLANTSHEIRTPLNSVIGFSNLLLKEDLNPKQLGYLKNIKASSDNLLVVLNDILDVSKIESGKMTFEKIVFSLPELISFISSSIDVKIQEKKQTFTVYVDPEIPQILTGDPTRLNQIILNLLSNSMKFTSTNGSISFSVKLKTKSASNVEIEFNVVDTGIGMTEEQLKNVFQAFTQAENSTTRKFGGTGLGLSIVKNLVELQGGEIFIESQINKGTKFIFILPFGIGVESNIYKTKNLETSIQNHEAENIRILLVEDNIINQQLTIDIIKSWHKGISVDIAENGVVALKALEDNNYSFVFMDIQMPLMDGIETTKRIRDGQVKGKENIPIIAMTAHALKDEKDKCFAAGMNDYLTKPFNPEDLFRKIKYYGSQQIQILVKAGKYIQHDNLASKIKINNNNNSKDNSEIQKFENISLEPLNKIYKGNAKQLNKILKMYYDTVGKEIEDMKNSFNSGEFQKIQNRAHALKPKMAYIGRNDIQEAARNIEISIKSNIYNNSELCKWIDEIYVEWQKIETELQKYLDIIPPDNNE